MEKVESEQNNYLNAFVFNCSGVEHFAKEWTIWAQEDGNIWYTVLDECGLPSDDNIIDWEDGEMLYLERDAACDQWGDNVGMISLDNGQTSKTVDELADEEVARVLADIESHDPQWFPEIAALCNDLSGLYDTDREWLEAFMSRLCREYVIG